jgi:hypothetical protein
MPRKGHSVEKIVYALRQVEAGKKVAEVAGRWGSRRRRSTVGKGSTPGWG